MKVSLFHSVQVSRLGLGTEDCPEEETLQSRRANTTVFRTLTKDALAREAWVECGLDSEVGISR